MRNVRSRVVGLLLLGGVFVGVASACSDDKEATGIGESALIQELARVYCEQGALCCSASGIGVNPKCVQERMAEYERRIEEMKRQGRTEYDEEAAKQCLVTAIVNRGTCQQEIDFSPFMVEQYLSGYCYGVFLHPETVEPDGACMTSDQCIEPPDGSADCLEGKCLARVTVADGEPCGMTDLPGVAHACGQYSWCDQTVPVCRPYPGEGEDCEYPCQPDLFCISGKCIRPELYHIGHLCSRDDECSSGICDPRVSACVPPVPTKTTGEPCTYPNDCISGVCQYDELAKRNECASLDPVQAAMVNAWTCDTDSVSGG